jgi:outer membrane protein TolC
VIAAAVLIVAIVWPLVAVAITLLSRRPPPASTSPSAAEASSPASAAEGVSSLVDVASLHRRIDELRGKLARAETERDAARVEAHRWRNGGTLRADLIRSELLKVQDLGKPENVIVKRLLERELNVLLLRAGAGE